MKCFPPIWTKWRKSVKGNVWHLLARKLNVKRKHWSRLLLTVPGSLALSPPRRTVLRAIVVIVCGWLIAVVLTLLYVSTLKFVTGY